MKAISNQKKRSWIWEYFEDIDIKEKISDKEESLKRCKVINNDEEKSIIKSEDILYIKLGGDGHNRRKQNHIILM
ncbi:hypothetical protein C1646_775831 [Rhizophagus diaphanus]|nr:hypothetical protein C1646_775831 [Rhizophagus diaphanus] [Rhizophagus sp. MUCL 43196]